MRWDWASWSTAESFGALLGSTKFAQKYGPPLFKLFFAGLLIASVVWATIVFSKVYKQALKERSKPSHVHTQRSH